VFSVAPTLAIRRIIFDGTDVVLEATGIDAEVQCPICGQFSDRIHRRYQRRPLDLPWRGRVVRLVVTVRSIRCDVPDCPQVTFVEQFGPSLPRGTRRTADATALLFAFARVAGGEAGARLARAAGLPTSPDTLLRLLRKSGVEPLRTPRVLGVDDLAIRRGHDYATLFLDMETGRPIDLVKGRDAAVLATWLRDHPGVEVIVRDRSGAYADGARAGAPAALQVADRFHLVHNASTALEELLRGRRRALEAALTAAAPVPSSDEGTMPTTDSPAQPATEFLSPTARKHAERRAARIARWEKVHALRSQGVGLMRIAHEMGMGPRTVRGLLASPIPPRNRQLQTQPLPLASPTLAPFASYLRDRWQADARNVSQLVREIVAQGYTGSTSLVRQADLRLATRAPAGESAAAGGAR
jgi:transposase